MALLRHTSTLIAIVSIATPSFFYSTGAFTTPNLSQQAGLAFDRSLPEMDGKKLIMKVADIRVAPGAKSQPHTHGCNVVVYVVSGAMRMQVRGTPDSVYRAGQTFYEKPTDIHEMSANASSTDSAHFTATFVCDHAGPLTTLVK